MMKMEALKGCWVILCTLLFNAAHAAQNGDVRINDYGNYIKSDGVLEIYLDNSWIPVCYDGFNDASAATACRQMGFSTSSTWEEATGYENPHGLSYKVDCIDQGRTIDNERLHLLRCGGTVQQVKCEGVHLYCKEPRYHTSYYNGEVYLDNSDSYLNSSGIVYLYYNSKALPVCCDSSFNKFAADSTCRQLGYTEASADPISVGPEQTAWDIGGEPCELSDPCLSQCFGNDIHMKQCYLCNVTCTFNIENKERYTSGSETLCKVPEPPQGFCSTLECVSFFAVSVVFVAVSFVLFITLIVMCVIFCKGRNHHEYAQIRHENNAPGNMGGDPVPPAQVDDIDEHEENEE